MAFSGYYFGSKYVKALWAGASDAESQFFRRSMSLGLKITNQVIYNTLTYFLHQMHELGVTENIVNIALTKAGEAQANKVLQINLVIGELSGFVPDCIQFYFDSLSKDTITQGAVLHFELVPTQLRCRNCSTIFRPQNTLWSCPKCQGQSVEIFKGREFYIESMEVE